MTYPQTTRSADAYRIRRPESGGPLELLAVRPNRGWKREALRIEPLEPLGVHADRFEFGTGGTHAEGPAAELALAIMVDLCGAKRDPAVYHRPRRRRGHEADAWCLHGPFVFRWLSEELTPGDELELDARAVWDWATRMRRGFMQRRAA